MLLVNPANGINATLYKNLSFNFIRDIAPVAGLVRTPNVMEVTPSLPVKTVAEFIAYCKANPGQDQHGVVRQRHLGAPVGRALQVDDRLRHGARAVQGRRPGADRPDRRPGAGDLRQPAVVHRPHQGRQAARPGGDVRAARAVAAGRADRRRDGAGLRGDRLVRHRHAEGHAARDHRQGQRRGQPRAGRPEDARAAGRTRRQADRRHAGRLRQDHRRRDGEVGEGRRASGAKVE